MLICMMNKLKNNPLSLFQKENKIQILKINNKMNKKIFMKILMIWKFKTKI